MVERSEADKWVNQLPEDSLSLYCIPAWELAKANRNGELDPTKLLNTWKLAGRSSPINRIYVAYTVKQAQIYCDEAIFAVCLGPNEPKRPIKFNQIVFTTTGDPKELPQQISDLIADKMGTINIKMRQAEAQQQRLEEEKEWEFQL